jgi:DNA-3-methyladenine glycosylase II
VKPKYWEEAKAHLSRRDKVLRRLVKKYPDADLGTRGDAFQTLARAITGQQISVKAAESIWKRFAAAAGKLTAAEVHAMADEAIRVCGYSGSKVRYMKDLALHFHTGLLNPRRWGRMGDEKVIEDLIRVKGIGRWSAEMFLIFTLMRPDVLPVDDLGLRRAMELHYNKGKPLTKAKMREIGEAWAPYRSAATWYLWRSLDEVNF